MGEYSGKRALVTGASAGIGAEFARQLAAKGADLVLVARREDRLKALADELRGKHQIDAVWRTGDLSVRDAAGPIWESLEAEGLGVHILVNNAGFGLPGYFHDSTWIEQRDFIELMVSSYAHLAYLAIPPMQAKGWGRIVNVASLAGLAPGSAGHTLYGASKAFLVSMSQSLAGECDGTGVKVSALCPGFTYSEFHDVNGTREQLNKLPKWMMQQADEVVAEGLDGLEKGRVVVVPGGVNKSIAFTARHLPRSVVEKAAIRQSRRFRRRK